MVAPCCGNVYPCKKCHDAEEDHVLESQKVEMMVCMACNLQQTPAGVRLLPCPVLELFPSPHVLCLYVPEVAARICRVASGRSQDRYRRFQEGWTCTRT